MTSTNYSGRTVDLFIFYGAKSSGEQRILPSLGSAGEVITGIQKLIQTFTTLFLTRQGTIPSRPELGTGFVTAMQASQIRDEADVFNQFALAVESIRSVLALQAESLPLPPDETFVSATLNSFELDKQNAKLSLMIQLVSGAGESRVVYLPIPLVIY